MGRWLGLLCVGSSLMVTAAAQGANSTVEQCGPGDDCKVCGSQASGLPNPPVNASPDTALEPCGEPSPLIGQVLAPAPAPLPLSRLIPDALPFSTAQPPLPAPTPLPTPSPLIRPRTGGQLYAQRLAILGAEVPSSQLPPDAFAEQWQAAQSQPTHQDWQRLLAQEAARMAANQGNQSLSVVLGDSLCLWLPPEHLSGDRLWLNQSISGEMTSHMLQRLEYLAPVRPDVIYVMGGINDLKHQVSPDVVAANLAQIVQTLRAQQTQADIIVLSILPTRSSVIPGSVVQQANQQIAAAVQQQGATFVDLQPAFADGTGLLRADLTTDGIHLNAEGYGVLATYLANP